MRTIKTITIFILAVGLLAGSAVGVAAQDEAADPMAPATFEVGFVNGPGGDELEGTTTDTEYGESRRGFGFVDFPFEAGDARASGLMTFVDNDEVVGNALARARAMRIVNDEGAWEGTSSAFLRMLEEPTAGPPFDHVADIAVLTGEGAYAGLTLVLTSDLDVWQGYIIPTDLLPLVPDLPAE